MRTRAVPKSFAHPDSRRESGPGKSLVSDSQ